MPQPRVRYTSLVVQSHLDGLVSVLIVHVMDDVQSHHIGLGQPFEGLLVVGLDLLVIQRAIGFRLDRVDDAHLSMTCMPVIRHVRR